MLQSVNDKFKATMSYHISCLEDKPQKYIDDGARKITKCSKRFTVQMKSLTFNVVELINLLKFLKDFKLACHTNGEHEGSAIWLLPYR